MTSSLIRPCEDSDIETIAAIYALHVLHGTASFETFPPTVEEMRARRAAILERRLPWIVIEREGKLEGYAYAGPYRAREAYRNTVENSIYLRPESAGQGLGKTLLAALIEQCAALGLRQMVGIIGDSKNTASIRLHESLGFIHAGILRSVGYKHGRWLDTVLMQRALGSGEETAP